MKMKATREAQREEKKSQYKKEWIQQKGMGFSCGQNHIRKKRERHMDGGRVNGSERKRWAIQGQAIC